MEEQRSETRATPLCVFLCSTKPSNGALVEMNAEFVGGVTVTAAAAAQHFANFTPEFTLTAIHPSSVRRTDGRGRRTATAFGVSRRWKEENSEFLPTLHDAAAPSPSLVGGASS